MSRREKLTECFLPTSGGDCGCSFHGIKLPTCVLRTAIEQTGIVRLIKPVTLSVEPKPRRNLSAEKILTGQGNHAVHEVCVEEGAADVTVTGLVGGHAGTGGEEDCHAPGGAASLGGEVVDKVLHPTEVRVALGRDAE